MPYRLSKIYNIAQSTWDETDAFDFFVGLDAPLYIVLSLLNDTSAEEFKGAKAIFDDHLSAILHFLGSAQSIRDRFLQEQQKNVHSRKSQILAFGYTKHGRQRSGIGIGVATEIASLGKQILNAGVDDCDIFSLLDLLQGGIGADRISDITAAIIYGNLPPLMLV